MYYKDLTYYRTHRSLKRPHFLIYKKIRNIGWLTSDTPFPQGKVSDKFYNKLLEIFRNEFTNIIQWTVNEEYATGINFTFNETSGRPVPCPLCGQQIVLQPGVVDLTSPSSENAYVLGRSALAIPSVNGAQFYAFPSLLLHSIREHGYLPPQEFIRSVEALVLQPNYDVLEATDELKSVGISEETLMSLDRCIVRLRAEE